MSYIKLSPALTHKPEAIKALRKSAKLRGDQITYEVKWHADIQRASGTLRMKEIWRGGWRLHDHDFGVFKGSEEEVYEALLNAVNSEREWMKTMHRAVRKCYTLSLRNLIKENAGKSKKIWPEMKHVSGILEDEGNGSFKAAIRADQSASEYRTLFRTRAGSKYEVIQLLSSQIEEHAKVEGV